MYFIGWYNDMHTSILVISQTEGVNQEDYARHWVNGAPKIGRVYSSLGLNEFNWKRVRPCPVG